MLLPSVEAMYISLDCFFYLSGLSVVFLCSIFYIALLRHFHANKERGHYSYFAENTDRFSCRYQRTSVRKRHCVGWLNNA